MTTGEISDAIRQCIAHCRNREQEVGYEFLSVRKCLYILGYDQAQADEVIRYCAYRGFSRAIDPIVESTYFSPNDKNAVNNMVTEYPNYDDCFWGIDQLRSRLQSVV